MTTNSNVTNQIKNAVTNSVPDVLDSILENCEHKKGNVIMMNMQLTKPYKQKWIKQLATVAAIFVLVIAGISSYRIYGARSVDSVISLEVNPSIEIVVNKNEKVLRVVPLNEDAKTTIGNMDFKNTNLDITVNAIVGSMLKNGFISNTSNSILISVEGKDEAKSTALKNKLSQEVSTLLSASSIESAILSQTLSEDSTLKELAHENSISLGKAKLIKQLEDKNPSYKFGDLAKLSINDLNLLIDSKHIKLNETTTSGTASDKAYIGTQKAIDIAVKNAGVDPSTVKDLEAELNYDDGKLFYEIEFESGRNEYEYYIDAVNGAIISYEFDEDDTDDDDDDEIVALVPSSTPTTKPSATPTAKPSSTPIASSTAQPSDNRMSAADARKAVINKYGGIIQKIEYNYDEKDPLYKGEALKYGEKVVFELNAKTKVFKKWDTSNDNSWDDFSHALSNLITMDNAADLVISKSGKADTFVQKIDFLWDDEEPLYQGEAFNRGVKYSFEIYAYGGDFQKWDSSTGDETWAEKYYNVK